jgi:glycerol-3-phosphate dehydrogenase
MKRNISALAERTYDLIIVGGGIFGVCAAWDATLRGLSVALLERGDFCHATSANHFKTVHGGIRYLQHADLYRIRESNRERNALLRIAPHLVQPLPVLVPTYGHGLQGQELLAVGLLLYDLIVFDRNRGLRDPQRRIPRGHFISQQECLRLFPWIEKEGLTGAAIFYDAQMYNPPRLALSYLRSAVQAGACVANYLEVTNFLRQGERVCGVEARDVLTGNQLEVRGKVVLNAAGPWAERLLGLQPDLRLHPKLSYSRDACFIVGRRLTGDCALAVRAKTTDPDAILSRGRRHVFMAPWRDYTLVGVWHAIYDGDPDEFTVTERDLQGFLDEVNEAYPALALTLKDVSMWNAGLVLFGENQPGATNLSYGKRSLVIDHASAHRLEGLVTLIGVRATTSRGTAMKAVDVVFKKLGRRPPKSETAVTPIYGGRIERFDEFLRRATAQRPRALSAEIMPSLIHNYGSEYQEVLQYIDEDPIWAGTVGPSKTLKAEIVHAVREEMAQKLADVVFRRTELGTGGHPGGAALQSCADLMASELKWDRRHVEQELTEVEQILRTRAAYSRSADEPEGTRLSESQVL